MFDVACGGSATTRWWHCSAQVSQVAAAELYVTLRLRDAIFPGLCWITILIQTGFQLNKKCRILFKIHVWADSGVARISS